MLIWPRLRIKEDATSRKLELILEAYWPDPVPTFQDQPDPDPTLKNVSGSSEIWKPDPIRIQGNLNTGSETLAVSTTCVCFRCTCIPKKDFYHIPRLPHILVYAFSLKVPHCSCFWSSANQGYMTVIALLLFGLLEESHLRSIWSRCSFGIQCLK